MITKLQEKLKRQQNFWQRENHDRPLIGFTGTYFATDTVQLIRCKQGHVKPDDIVIEPVLESFNAQFEAWKDCTGDLFWTASPLYQFHWLMAAVGAPVVLGNDSIWVEPIIKDYAQLDSFIITEENPWIQKLCELTDAIVENANRRYPVAANEFLSPLNALVELRGHTEFALDLYDRPDSVKRGLAKLTEIWSALVASQYQRIPDWYGGHTSAQRFIWAPGRIIEFNEDPVYMISPQFHKEIVMPSYCQVISQVEYPYIHIHSTQVHTLDNLLDLEDLPAIEFTPDYGKSIKDLIPIIAKIRDRKPIIVHAFFTAKEMQMITESMPCEGLCIISRVNTADEAQRLQEAIHL